MNDTAQKVNRSGVFTAYNMARPLTRNGRLDAGRLNKALGIALRKKSPDYETTLHSCSCPDFMYRRVTCKHMLAAQLKELSQ